MLVKFRIEVEEETADRVVEALTKYEHALQMIECERYGIRWEPKEGSARVPAVEPFHVGLVGGQRDFYNEPLGRELMHEVIEYDEGLPGYRGRRVVRFKRLDSRGPSGTIYSS